MTIGDTRDRDHLAALADRQCGVLTRRQALSALTPAAVRHRLARGWWTRVHRSVYVVQPRPDDMCQRRWIAVLGSAPGAVAAGRTALAQLGMRDLDTDLIDLLVPGTSRDYNHPPGIRVHRSTDLTERDVHQAASPPCTVAARSLVDAAAWASTDRQARTLIAAAFQQRLVRLHDVEAQVARRSRLRRRPVITLSVNDAARGAHALSEQEFAALCRRGRLPMPRLQAVHAGRGGVRYVVDADFDPYGVLVEIDGGHHTNVQQWWADMRRQNELWRPGTMILRFPAWAVRDEPDRVLRTVRDALRRQGWPG